MHNQATIVGYVSEIYTNDRGDRYLVVEDRSGEKVKSTACRCWSGSDKLSAALANIAPGQLVKVDGYITSNKSQKTGGWFTDFQTSYIKPLLNAALALPDTEHPMVAAAKKTFAAPSRVPGQDDW